MKSTSAIPVIVALTLALVGVAGFANAIVIDFTGGTATGITSGTTTPGLQLYTGVTTYDEDGFTMEFIGTTSDSWVGDYYWNALYPDILNDVAHAHFGTDFGGNDSTSSLSAIRLYSLNGAGDFISFDLNYFEVTTNTSTLMGGGGLTEMAYITGYNAVGVAITADVLLPSEDWGDGTTGVWLDSSFNDVAYVEFTVTNVFGLGLDNFYINEAAPPVPEPATLLLFGAGLLGLACRGIRRRKSAI